MANVDDTVRENIRAYPGLFRDRAQVLHFILCVIGTGYEWVNGEPINTYDEKMTPWSPEAEDAKFAESIKGQTPYIIEILRDLHETEKAERLITLSNLDFRVSNLPASSVLSNFYPQSDYALLMNVPDDVTPEWAEACEQMRFIASLAGWKF